MYHLTATYEIWDDDDGDTHLEVGEDSEGLDQVEIREHVEGEETIVVCCSPEQATKLGDAIQEYILTRETVRISSDEGGNYLEVGAPKEEAPEEGSTELPEPDEDLIEIREYGESGEGESAEEVAVICCTLEQAVYVKNAVHRYLKAREFLLKNPTGAVVE